MYKISLVNMPFASLTAPSIALTQLQAVVKRRFGDRIEVKVHYLNQDFAKYLTVSGYQKIDSFIHHPTGLAEWFFRQVAFPRLPDNAEDYFRRYYPQHDPRNRKIKSFILKARSGSEAHLVKMIAKHGLDRADLIGFTSMFAQNMAVSAMARLIKEYNPEAVVVVGGANCEAPMGRELVDHVPATDYVFSGPALKSFPQLIECLLDGKVAACHRINGVFSRKNQIRPPQRAGGEIPQSVSNAVNALGDELNINDYIEPDYTGFLDIYESNFPENRLPVTLYFETSRGCWWGERAHCTFCGLNGSSMAYRSLRPELALQLIRSLYQYAPRCSALSSVDNILPKSYLKDVLPFLDTPDNLTLFYEVKADLVEEDFKALKKARVLSIQPGIEALNTTTLKLMRKGTSAFQNLQFLLNCVRFDIHPGWNLLVGFPHEPIAVYEKYLTDIPFLTHLPPPGGVYPVRFDRFSPYFQEAETYGLDLQPLDWYALAYPFPPEVLKSAAYYFADHNFAAPYAQNVAKMIMKMREKVSQWTDKWRVPGERPQLYLHERVGGVAVHDSRLGVATEHAIEDQGRTLLEALSKPHRVPTLAKQLPGLDVETELMKLAEKKLVFQEGDRFLSLVGRSQVSAGVPNIHSA